MLYSSLKFATKMLLTAINCLKTVFKEQMLKKSMDSYFLFQVVCWKYGWCRESFGEKIPFGWFMFCVIRSEYGRKLGKEVLFHMKMSWKTIWQIFIAVLETHLHWSFVCFFLLKDILSQFANVAFFYLSCKSQIITVFSKDSVKCWMHWKLY